MAQSITAYSRELPLRNNLDELKVHCQVQGKRTFLDVSSFPSREVANYFNEEMRPMENPGQFLRVLEVVLQVTNSTISEPSQEYQESFKEAVRDRFLALYQENLRGLSSESPSSRIHVVARNALPSLESSDKGITVAESMTAHSRELPPRNKLEEMRERCQVQDKRTFLDVRSFPYSWEVANFLNGETRPMENPGQFLRVLEVVLQVTNPTISEPSQEYQESFKEAVRDQFLALYQENLRGLYSEDPSSGIHVVARDAMASVGSKAARH